MKPSHKDINDFILYFALTLSKFRTPEGNEVPGLSPTASAPTNIEIAKMYLEKELGERRFSEAYRFLEVREWRESRNRRKKARRTTLCWPKSLARTDSSTFPCSTSY